MPLPEAARVALVEDDPIMGESIVQWLALEGYHTDWWRSGADALAGLGRCRPDVMICDIRLPDMNGEEIFRRALPALGNTPVLFITAFGEIDQAVRLVRAGADDYLTKPFDIERLLGRIRNLAGRHRAESGILGVSPAIARIEAILQRIADLDSTVLITGESGVGKEVAARFLHGRSARRQSPFMAVNCAAIPSELIESELFGHEKGAFTGAHVRHEGYAERAREGILFLDEVFDLPSGLQAKLLRLIEDRQILRIGGERSIPFAARVVAATNVDPEQRVHDGRFREDLFYRLNVIRVAVPPLRERHDDILPLVRLFIAEYAERFGRPVRGMTTLAEDAAMAHDWPGNVRELRNRIERGVALAEGPLLGPGDLFPERHRPAAEGEERIASLAQTREFAERRQILAALDKTGWDVAAAAKLLSVSRSTLFDRMRRLKIPRQSN
jgi:DNA-binding NtrC family response regulator